MVGKVVSVFGLWKHHTNGVSFTMDWEEGLIMEGGVFGQLEI